MNGLTIGELLLRGTGLLQQNGIAFPRLDAEILLAHVLGQDRVYLYRESDLSPGAEQVRQYMFLVGRRSGGEPVAYLTGYKEFMGLTFKVGPHVLIPRPETELMVERACAALSGWQGSKVAVDVGTGSGAVAVSLARLVPGLEMLATDISPEALAIARENADRLGAKVCFAQGDLLTPLDGLLPAGSVALVAANLPYIPSEDWEQLPRDVRLYEPQLALDGGPGGLELYRRLVPQAGCLLAARGSLLMEIGPGQENRVLELVAPPRWSARVLKDLAGRPRLVEANRNGDTPPAEECPRLMENLRERNGAIPPERPLQVPLKDFSG